MSPAPKANEKRGESDSNASSAPAWLTILKDVWPTVAAGVAALWIVYLYFYQRIHAPRVELKLEAKYRKRKVGAMLVVKIRLKNVGKVRVGLAHFGTALRVFVPLAMSEKWPHYGSRRIFEEQNAVEPDEELEDEHVTYFPEPPPAVVRAVAEVNSDKRAGWATKAQLPLLEDDDD